MNLLYLAWFFTVFYFCRIMVVVQKMKLVNSKCGEICRFQYGGIRIKVYKTGLITCSNVVIFQFVILFFLGPSSVRWSSFILMSRTIALAIVDESGITYVY